MAEAWGPGPFDNDDANDFADDIGSRDDLAAAEAALDNVLAATDTLDAATAAKAVAAAEILTLLVDRPSDETEYPDEVEEWAAESEHEPDDALLAKAGRALDRVLAAPSALFDQWKAADADDFAEWQESIADIKHRLVAPPAEG